MDSQSSPAVEGKPSDPLSGEENLAAVWSKKSGEEIKGCGLPCTVWSQKPGDPPGLKAHGKPVHSADMSEAFHQILSFKDCGQPGPP